MKLIININLMNGGSAQRTIEFEDPADINKGVLLALYQAKGLANIIEPATGKSARGPVHQIAEKARIGAFVNDFERQ